MRLVAELEGLFGVMPGFSEHAVRGIERGSALVVVDEDDVLAASLLSREDGPHHIRWLAVRQAVRSSGVGSLLMAEILRQWPTGDIEVVTFASSIPGGEPARHFYERFGFELAGPAEEAPDGGARDLYVLRR